MPCYIHIEVLISKQKRITSLSSRAKLLVSKSIYNPYTSKDVATVSDAILYNTGYLNTKKHRFTTESILHATVENDGINVSVL